MQWANPASAATQQTTLIGHDLQLFWASELLFLVISMEMIGILSYKYD
jgi:hypothetical protein